MEQLEQIIGYTFQNKKLLKQALTHSSYANEKKLGKLGCNERLEFLGDAVLELISSDFLYAKFTQVPEGELTKKRASLVCEPSLAYCARQFGLFSIIVYMSIHHNSYGISLFDMIVKIRLLDQQKPIVNGVSEENSCK